MSESVSMNSYANLFASFFPRVVFPDPINPIRIILDVSIQIKKVWLLPDLKL